MYLKTRGIVILVMSTSVTIHAVMAQEFPRSIQQNPDSMPLRVNTRLIQVNVVVHDSKGAPVSALSRGEFTVIDEGRPRHVALFLKSLATGDHAVPTPAAPSHPLTVDNRRTPQQGSANVTILLIDSLNMRESQDVLYVRRELPRFIKELRPGDAVAIYELSGPTVRVLHEFSDNTESLIQAAEHGRGVMGHWLHSADTSSDMPDRRIRIEWTLAALESVALHVAALPGRKNLIWVSSAFPLTLGFESTEQMANGLAHAQNGDLQAYQDRLKRLASILNWVDVAIFPVDPDALQVDAKYQVEFKAAAAATPASRRLQTPEKLARGISPPWNCLPRKRAAGPSIVPTRQGKASNRQ